MTEKENWKNILFEEIEKRDISEWLMPYIKLPCVMLSSVERLDVIEEKFICPYCFNSTTVKYSTSKKYSIVRTCEHCGNTFEKRCYIDKNHGNAELVSGTYDGCVVVTADTINGIEGALYLYVNSAQVRYSIKEKRVNISPNITDIGFVSENKRFRYKYGNFTRARIACSSRYSPRKYYGDDAFFAYAERFIQRKGVYGNNVMWILERLELMSEKAPDPANSVSVKRAQRFMEQYAIEEPDVSLFETSTHLFVKTMKYDKLKGKYYYRGYCDACNKYFSRTQNGEIYRYNDELKCPNCGKTDMVLLDGLLKSSTFAILEKVPESVLVMRIVKCSYTAKSHIVSITATEEERVFYNFDKNGSWNIRVVCKEGGFWKLKKDTEPTLDCIKEENLIVAPEAKEFLRYTGFTEYCESKKTDHRLNLDLTTVSRYLQACAVTNCLEKIVKVGWYTLCDDCLRNIINGGETELDIHATTLSGILRLPKRLVKYLSEHYTPSPNKSNVRFLQKFYSIDEDVMTEDLEWCEAHSVDGHNIGRITHFLAINVHQACEYLERVRINQCYEPKHAVIAWYDYLNAAKNIDADLTDKTVRYPSSLKREHDRVTFKYKIIMDQKKEEEFKANCDQYGERYSYENDDFQIIMPESMQDLFEEGRRLNHCVGSYADRIVAGKTCICFLRRKETPNQPYFTIEVSPDQEYVRQIHGLSNRLVDRNREKYLYRFLKEWARVKALDISVL